MPSDDDKSPVWVPSPGAAHSSTGTTIGYWEALARNMEFRRIYARPDEEARERQREQIARDKRASSGKLRKGEIIGPPDPRAGRVKMTK